MEVQKVSKKRKMNKIIWFKTLVKKELLRKELEEVREFKYPGVEIRIASTGKAYQAMIDIYKNFLKRLRRKIGKKKNVEAQKGERKNFINRVEPSE